MNTKAIRQLADVTLDKYRSSIPRKAFEEFVKDIIAGENRATAFRYEASPICRASFPSTLDEDDARCTVEVTVYRLNAVAVTAFLLDGPETLLRHIGLDERDADPRGLIRDATRGGTADGESQLGGEPWQRFVSDDDRTRALVRSDPDSTVVISGDLPYEALEAFATTLG